MPTPADEPVWRALTIRSHHEKTAAQHLRERGLEEFLPLYTSKRSWADRTTTIEMPLFPGYVFCRFAATQRLLAVSSPGVASVVGFGAKDAPVDPQEIENIRKMVASGLPLLPRSYVRPGQAVQIQSGPLAGLRGTVIREKGLWHVIVNVELLGRSVAAEIGREAVQAENGVPQLVPARVAVSI